MFYTRWISAQLMILNLVGGKPKQKRAETITMSIERKMMMLNLVERRAQPRRAGKSDTDGEELRIGIAADTGKAKKNYNFVFFER